MTDTEQPSQWAEELWDEVMEAARLQPCFAKDCDPCKAAALTIQRAFAERDAELVGALRRIENEPRFSRYDAAQVLADMQDIATAALKSREAGHG